MKNVGKLIKCKTNLTKKFLLVKLMFCISFFGVNNLIKKYSMVIICFGFCSIYVISYYNLLRAPHVRLYKMAIYFNGKYKYSVKFE